jgi:hypothetical protein
MTDRDHTIGFRVNKHILVFLLLFVSARDAAAADASRCGTDAFGNEVCLDKNGVLTNAPVKTGDDQSGSSTAVKRSRSAEEADNTGRENRKDRVRCGIDPFGNRVCR